MTDDIHPQMAPLFDDDPPPDPRRLAEAIAASDPALAEEFRALAGVRDLVAGLSRPAAPGVSDAVLRRIASRRRARSVARVAAAAVLIVGGAAVLTADRPRVAAPAVAPRTAAVASIPIAVAAEPAVVLGPPTSSSTEPEAAPEMVGPPDDRPLIARRLLERPRPYRIFMGTPGRAADAEEVAKLVGLSSHRDFHRFDLPASDGRPGATVFAAELDAGELRTLRMRLVDAMSDGLDEQETGAAVVADVTRAGTATTFRGDPAAELLMPQQRLALRLPPDVPAPAEAPARTPAVEPGTPAPADEGPSVILIWLPSDRP